MKGSATEHLHGLDHPSDEAQGVRHKPWLAGALVMEEEVFGVGTFIESGRC